MSDCSNMSRCFMLGCRGTQILYRITALTRPAVWACELHCEKASQALAEGLFGELEKQAKHDELANLNHLLILP